MASKYILKSLGTSEIDSNLEVLDAGCGTGLFGTFLAEAGGKNIDGIDLSPGMLEVARNKGVYRYLKLGDLSQPVSEKNCSYDIAVCIGTFTQGHIGPDALAEFVRIARGGFVVATILESIWKSGGYESKLSSLVNEGKSSKGTTDAVQR